MEYKSNYPEIYAELARQGKSKSSLAKVLGISENTLRFKQTKGDFTIKEAKATAKYLTRSVICLFGMEPENETLHI